MRLFKRIVEKIKNDGWKSLYFAIIRRFEYWKVHFYIEYILRNWWVNRLFPYKKPTILLLSYPRSGSSWAGAILSHSENLAYMFEPITRPYQKYQAGQAMPDLKDPETYQNYLKYTQEAFWGMPPKQLDASESLRQFSIFGRKQRQLLIKEVNPRAAELYCKHFHPTILFLVRHPAAVALSFWEQGWLASPDVMLYAANFNGDEWEKFGYAYGIAIKTAWDTIRKFSYPNRIIVYDELASNPLAEFKKILEYLDVKVPGNFDDVINEYCFTGAATQGYHIRRVSSMMIAKWKHKLDADTVSKIRRGYLKSGFDYYNAESDWELPNTN